MAVELYLKNDNLLQCTVTFTDSGAASTAATVTAEVVARSSTSTVVETGLALTQINTDGKYEKLLDESSTGYIDKGWYTADVTIATSDGSDGYIELDFQARTRRIG